MTAQDTAAVEQAMRRTGTLDWANRDVRALSGGERQRVYLAMALAQGGTTILLDEPGAFLDVRAQFELLDLLRSVAAGGKAVVLVMHELPQAMQYADRIALLGGGRLLGCDHLRCPCCHRCGGSGVWCPFVPCAGWGVVCEGGG